MTEISAKTTENDSNWQRNSAKMTGKDRKWRKFLRFPMHIATSGARHFTFSSALLRRLLPTVQLTYSWNSFHSRYLQFFVLPPEINQFTTHNTQRQLLCGSSFFFRDLTAAYFYTNISQFIHLFSICVFFLIDEKDGSDEYNLPVISNWVSIHWGLRGLGSGEPLSEKGYDLKVVVFSTRF